MSYVDDMLDRAAKYAIKDDRRTFIIGAVGERTDGALVFSRNLPAEDYEMYVHAEARLTKKSDVGTVVYVARVRRDDGNWGNARPCRSCRRIMKSRGINLIYYTIEAGEYGVMDLNKWVDGEVISSGYRLGVKDLGRRRRGPS